MCPLLPHHEPGTLPKRPGEPSPPEGERGTLLATDPGKALLSLLCVWGPKRVRGWGRRGPACCGGHAGTDPRAEGRGAGAGRALAGAAGPAMEQQPREQSTSVSSLSAPSREQRGKQQKKCKMHLKILFHFPFRQKQKYLNNRGQKQLLQNFQELGKIKSPVRRTVFRRLPPLSCQTWACSLGNLGRNAPGAASPFSNARTSLAAAVFQVTSVRWDTCPLFILKSSFQKGMRQISPPPPPSVFFFCKLLG